VKSSFWKVVKKKRLVIIVFFLGLLLRLILSVQIYSGDVNNHVAWGKDALRFGFAGIYQRSFEQYGVMTPTYPPIPLYFFTFFYWLFGFIYQLAWELNSRYPFFPSKIIWLLEDQDILPAFLKIPAILADLGIAYVIFIWARKVLREKAGNWPLFFAGLILFNPAFFYNSAVWGQIEAVPLLFILASFYTLFLSGKKTLSVVFLSFAILTKQTSIVFMPIFAIGYLSRFGLKKSVWGGLVFGLIGFAFFLPFFKQGNLLAFPLETYWAKIQTGSGSNYVTDHAFNFWALTTGLGKIPDWKSFCWGISYSQWGYFFFGVIALLVFYRVWRRRQKLTIYVLAALLIPFSAFLFLTRMHERYLEQALPFLLILSFKKKAFLALFLPLCLIYLINLYHNWWAPGSQLLQSIFSQVSVINFLIVSEISIFAFLCVRYMREEN